MNQHDFDTVEHNGITITLTQEAYLQSDGNDDWYQAVGVDAEGNEYMIKWEIVSDACDWTQYEVTKL